MTDSCATQSYDTVTDHFINQDWEMLNAVLQTSQVEGSHTGENIAEILKDCQKLSVLQLVFIFLLEKQMIVYASTPTLIGHKLKLINDVPTRWNSSMVMLKRLSEQRAAIMAIASDDNLKINKTTCNNLRSYCLTFEEHSIVEGLINVLSPFEKATTILCAENSPTMNKVLVCMAKTNKILEIESMTTGSEYEAIPLMAALLNPDTKSLSFLSAHEQEAAHRLLLDKALALIDENGRTFKLSPMLTKPLLCLTFQALQAQGEVYLIWKNLHLTWNQYQKRSNV
ncbi:hypothetical protein MAR_037925 [Mya arenaria]|uniref:Uncharacterized protein n=1 Tax=Mya arenaria TaxID=6604 RepID=A0ABY7FTR2_MYAAR|nr:hypothetical protein MAR_037925 [Mya arenaria]